MKKLSYFLVILLFLLIIPLPFLVTEFLIKVKVECKSQFGSCPKEIMVELKKFENMSLFNAKRKASYYLKNNSLVLSYSTQYFLFNTLEVNLILNKPQFAIRDTDSGKTYTLDAKGNILGETESSSLPTIIQQGNKTNLFALNLILGVYQMYQVLNGEIKDGSLLVDIPGGIRVIFPLEGDREVLLGALRLIHNKITTDAESAQYKEIDMRYKNPVLR